MTPDGTISLHFPTHSNLLAQRATLHLACTFPEAVPDLLLELKPEYFGDSRCRTLFEAIIELFQKDQPIDELNVIEALRRSGKLHLFHLGEIGVAELLEIPIEAWLMPFHAKRMAESLRDHHQKTTMKRTMAELINRDAPAEHFSTAVMEHEAAAFRDEDAEPIGDVWNSIVCTINEPQNQMPYGYRDLDDLTAGLHPGELTVLAARPGVGKSAIALNIALNIASTKKRVLFLSLEMTKESLAQRLVGAIAGVNTSEGRHGRLTDNQCEKLIAAGGKVQNLPLKIMEATDTSIRKIDAYLRKLRYKKEAPEVLFVDYIQILPTPELPPATPKNQQVGYVSRSLKSIAMKYAIPIIGLSQLKRPVDEHDLMRDPILSDLKESGSLEQDADNVLFISSRKESNDPQRRRILLSKQRNGPIGITHLRFIKEFTRFEDYPPETHNFKGADLRAYSATFAQANGNGSHNGNGYHH